MTTPADEALPLVAALVRVIRQPEFAQMILDVDVSVKPAGADWILILHISGKGHPL